MSYLDTHADPAARTRAIIAVGAVHALIGAGLVAGLTVTGLVNVDDPPFVVIDPTAPDQPQPADPAPTSEPETSYTPPVAPERPFDLGGTTPLDPAPLDDSLPDDTVLTIPTGSPTGDLIPMRPNPTPAFAPVGARPRNSPAGWIDTSDYPRPDIVREREGVAGYRLVISSNGRVDACEITRSSGSATLDAATCRLIERRARFDPAKGGDGQAVVGTYTGSVSWEIPD